MLREASTYADWCEKTMSMMREQQFEACEQRLSAQTGAVLFAPDTTDADAQSLLERSYYRGELEKNLYTIEQLRGVLMAQLPIESLYLPLAERELLEKALMAGGKTILTEWDDIGAAEALTCRLWCSFYIENNHWLLEVLQPLREPLLAVMGTKEYKAAGELLFRYNMMVEGLLYLTGFLHAAQPLQSFCTEIMRRDDKLALSIVQRYLKSTFEYIVGRDGELVLLHPGLADPHRIDMKISAHAMLTVELSQEMIAGSMNGLLSEEEAIHEGMCRMLAGALRPEYDVAEAAQDLRMLAKQEVGVEEMGAVMASMLCVLPTDGMKQALLRLHQFTPRWLGLQAMGAQQ